MGGVGQDAHHGRTEDGPTVGRPGTGSGGGLDTDRSSRPPHPGPTTTSEQMVRRIVRTATAVLRCS
jgi:hypothetical protein